MSHPGLSRDQARRTPSQAQYAERGHTMLSSDFQSDDSIDYSAVAAAIAASSDSPDFPLSSTSISSPRHVRIPPSRLTDSSSGTSSAIQSLTSASTLSTLEGKLDLSPTEPSGRRGLLRDNFLDQWKDDSRPDDLETPEEMQKNDPLGTQIWKLYHKTKGQLPNGERLENLTWRMMSMNLRRKEMERRQQAYGLDGVHHEEQPADQSLRLGARGPGLNAPSGIAQLRKSSEQASKNKDEHMNLDDFIVPSSIGTPAGVSPDPSASAMDGDTSSQPLSAIPIKLQQRIQSEEYSIAASAPSVPILDQSRANQEFAYVPRHVRKTSIDERRVSGDSHVIVHMRAHLLICVTAWQATCRSLADSTAG